MDEQVYFPQWRPTRTGPIDPGPAKSYFHLEDWHNLNVNYVEDTDGVDGTLR